MVKLQVSKDVINYLHKRADEIKIQRGSLDSHTSNSTRDSVGSVKAKDRHNREI